MDDGPVTAMVCAGCGAEGRAEAPFRCPEARDGDGVDHVLTRVLDVERVTLPDERDAGDSPFSLFRELLHPYQVGRARGLSDGELLEIFDRLDERVAAVDGRGFRVTPLGERTDLAARLRLPVRLFAKDETGNVSGSHKGRHLMGVALFLQVAERVGLRRAGARTELAISSCGNAALAAAVVARAADRRLRVFIPTWADPRVVERLQGLGATIEVCERQAGVPGDPCTHGFRKAVSAGAVPFSCQGTDNGLAVEGGMTLGYELCMQLAEEDIALDRLFIQVGGGALASATIQALREAQQLGAVLDLPRVHAVQTDSAHPLVRAWDRLTARIVEELPGDHPEPSPSPDAAERAARAALIAEHQRSPAVSGAIRHAATHRADFMWPWEEEPRSIATGILDDETYDWLAVVRGMLTTGGYPVLVSEETLREAQEAACAEGLDACATGTSGLAGLMTLSRAGLVEDGTTAGVLVTGVDRGGGHGHH